MKILIVVPDDRLGGAEQLLRNLTLFYLKDNNIVHVLFFKKPLSGQWTELNEFPRANLHFTKATSESKGLPAAFRNIWKLRKHRFDQVYSSHLHMTSFVGVLIKFGIVKKRFFIGRESTSYFLRYKGKQLFFFKILYSMGYSSLDLLICQSSVMKDQLLNGLPKLMKKINIQVIPNPINLESIGTVTTKTKIDTPFVVTAGRLIWDKGYDILIDAFQELKKDFPRLKLIILGEGNCRKELEDQIKKLNLIEDVILEGQVANVYSYFNEAELCVVSSRIEGFPNVLLQMMSQNNKVVSTKCAGGIEALNGVFTAETNDVKDLYLKMRKTLITDTEGNRIKFKKELENRSYSNFSHKIEEYL